MARKGVATVRSRRVTTCEDSDIASDPKDLKYSWMVEKQETTKGRLCQPPNGGHSESG